MKTSVSSHPICARFTHSPPPNRGNSPLWGLIKSNKCLVFCYWLDSGHHCDALGDTKHASVQLGWIQKQTQENVFTAHRHTQTCTDTFFVYPCYIFLWLHSDYLVIFCSDCASGLWRGLWVSTFEKKQRRDRWYLTEWCVWPVQRTNKSDTSLRTRALSVSGETGTPGHAVLT